MSAPSLVSLLLPWLAGVAIGLGLLLWGWRWLLRRGPEVAGAAASGLRTLRDAAGRIPAVRAWIARHPRAVQFLQARVSPASFTGLPLTLLTLAFLYTVSLLLGIVQDYVFSDPLIAADLRLANLLYAFRTPAGLTVFAFVTLFGSARVIVVTAAVLSVALWFQRQRLFLVTLWLTLVVSEGATVLGKTLVHRARPDVLLRAITETSFSFPSGHATAATAFYGVVAYLGIRTSQTWRARVHTLFGVLLGVGLIDVSRLYLGVHFLSDVLAGDLVGLAGLLFAVSVTEWRLAVGPHPSLRAVSPALLVSGAAELLLVVTVFVVTPPALLHPEPPAPRPVDARRVPALFDQGTLPRLTETILGTPQEPVNVIVIAPEGCLVAALERAHWLLADRLSVDSLRRAISAALRGGEDPRAPLTPSFYATRPHDYGFEKATEAKTVRVRHHARVWRTGYVTERGALFVGTVSLDTGMKWGITHTIAPDIDTERELLVADVERAGGLVAPQRLRLVPPMLARNFAGDPFFTDGQARLVTLPCGNPDR